MVRGNCDYLFLQPIFNKTQRDILWDLEAAFMDRDDFNVLMDDIIVRENLPGNSASEPKKKVQIMVCCDFEDSSVPQEKFFTWCPVAMDDLPPFRLCAKKYWEESLRNNRPMFGNEERKKPLITELHDAELRLQKLNKG
jgi:hypothetical protein